MSDPKNPEPNDQVIDVSDIVMTPYTEEEAEKLTPLHEGIGDAVSSILKATTEQCKRVGITVDEAKELAEAWTLYQRVTKVEPAIEKLSELTKRTKQVRGHDLGVLVASLAAKVRRRAGRGAGPGEAAGPFVDLLDYQYGPAQKAAATKAKAKAEEAKKAAQAAKAEKTEKTETPKREKA
jgi:hypothetical protein